MIGWDFLALTENGSSTKIMGSTPANEETVLWIHDILVRIRALWPMDPDPAPAIFVSDLQDGN